MGIILTEHTAFAILQLQPHATSEQIRAAYSGMARKVHPDKVGGNGASFI